MKPWTVTKHHTPDNFINVVDDQGKWYQKEDCKHRLKCLNHCKDKYGWDNDENEDNRRLVVNNPEYTEIPDIELGGDDYGAEQIIKSSESQLACSVEVNRTGGKSVF